MLVLYAEDDIEDFDIFVAAARSINADAEILNTTNGLETINLLEELVELPQLIFLDINMPAMDGKACLKMIRNDLRLRSIPVIIYTTSNNAMDKEHCMQLGATAYLSKPNSIDKIEAALEPYFRLVSGS